MKKNWNFGGRTSLYGLDLPDKRGSSKAMATGQPVEAAVEINPKKQR